MLGSCVSKESYEQLQASHNQLQDEYEDLQNQYEDLQSEYEDLQSEYNTLHNAFENLIDEYNKLGSSYSFKKSVSSSNTINTNRYDKAQEGRVVYEGRGDYYIVETQSYYVLLETSFGWLSTGDVLIGDLHSFGSKDVLKNGKTTMRVYIEDYWSDINRCYDWLKDHDKLR